MVNIFLTKEGFGFSFSFKIPLNALFSFYSPDVNSFVQLHKSIQNCLKVKHISGVPFLTFMANIYTFVDIIIQSTKDVLSFM